MDGISERTGQPSLWERIGDQICGFQPQIYYLFVLESVLLMLMLFSVLYVDPGSASYIVVQINFILLGITLAPSLLILYTCSQRRR